LEPESPFARFQPRSSTARPGNHHSRCSQDGERHKCQKDIGVQVRRRRQAEGERGGKRRRKEREGGAVGCPGGIIAVIVSLQDDFLGRKSPASFVSSQNFPPV